MLVVRSCVCVLSGGGCAVYSVQPFGVCASYSQAASAGWGLVELRYDSSLLAVCGSGLSSTFSPRTVHLLDARSRRVLSELHFAGGVLDVRLTGERLVCALQDKLHVFELRALQPLYTVSAAASARGQCCAVPFEQPPPSTSAAFLAAPSQSSRGDVSVYSYDGQLLAAVRAHSSAIRMLALSSDGRLLASCSTAGTLIRLFALPLGNKVATLRRGTLSSHVSCLAFNPTASRLCVGSRDSSSVHIFDLSAYTQQQSGSSSAPQPSKASWPVVSLLRQSVASLSSSLSPLSGRLEDIMEPSRGAAVLTLSNGNEPLTAAFTQPTSTAAGDGVDELLHVVTRTGALFTYALSGSSEGAADSPGSSLECRLLSVQSVYSDATATQLLSTVSL